MPQLLPLLILPVRDRSLLPSANVLRHHGPIGYRRRTGTGTCQNANNFESGEASCRSGRAFFRAAPLGIARRNGGRGTTRSAVRPAEPRAENSSLLRSRQGWQASTVRSFSLHLFPFSPKREALECDMGNGNICSNKKSRRRMCRTCFAMRREALGAGPSREGL